MKKISSSLKEKLILTAWISGLIIASVLLWSLSSSFRSMLTMNSVNSFLSTINDERRLLSPVEIQNCYKIADSNSLFCLFSIMWEGIMVPCAAEISQEGTVINTIPIGNHASQIIKFIPEEQIQIYLKQIVSALNKKRGLINAAK